MNNRKLSKETRSVIITRARQMRTTPTQAEEKLWLFLRKGRLGGHKFRRQHRIGAYIVDFYCPQAKLVIELDGEIHDTQKDYDQKRQDDLLSQGYQVIRFTNNEILNAPYTALEQILEILNE